MELLSFRFTSYGFLLVCALWSVTNCTTTVPSATPEATATTSPVTTLPPTTPPLPEDVTNITVVNQTVTSVTITFVEVTGVKEYVWFYYINGTDKNKTFEESGNRLTLEGLMPAQIYDMILHTKTDDGRLSRGSLFNATTAPENVDRFEAVEQNENNITLKWTTKPGVSVYILSFDGNETPFNEDNSEYVVTNLNSSTQYSFVLFSEFESVKSTGFSLTTNTAPSKATGFQKVSENQTAITLQWENEDSRIDYILQFNEEKLNITSEELSSPAKYTVTGLQNATKYTFTLVTVFLNTSGGRVSISTATAPRDAEGFKPANQSETSITLRWEPVPNIQEYILQSDHGNVTVMGENEETIGNLTSGRLYDFTLFAVFETVRSRGSSLTAATVPRDATNFKAQIQTETTITLQWDKVDEIQDYQLEFDGKTENVKPSGGSVLNHKVTNLESGAEYQFILRTNFTELLSQGILHVGATVPPPVSSVLILERKLNSITLQWENPKKDWQYSLEINGKTETVKPTGGLISHSVPSLDPGTVYPFNLTTLFRSLQSPAYQNKTVTVINCAIVDWRVTETTIQGAVDGVFTSATATNGLQTELNSGSGQEVIFKDLYPGDTYDMTLMYEGLEQCRHRLTVVPPSLTARCKFCKSGYSVCIEWDSPRGVWDSVEITVANKAFEVSYSEGPSAVLESFQPAKTYQASIISRSGPQKSKASDFPCATDNRGVIAGAFFGVLLFLILVCAVAFVMLRRPDIISRRKNSAKGGGRTSAQRSKGIPLEKFPAHFNDLSADENKGFSLEYEDLADVGTKQSQKVATAQENRPKNRFINVLPYDRSRVKLSASSPHNDYINASYMPGYNSDREFIAAQGPMPSTVNDFWRMIWEQKVRGIVMVTNCTEGGRTKCEQYWPDSNARVCGDLAVFTKSQQKETDWTLREFTVKHRVTSEERTVKHFHFTAWPDHGVPDGTEVLIQFRALVRKHIQMEGAGTPTVVHCSAGVGRTGTLIALDMLQQQMEREKMVDINGFVHKMRLNRPHMVQTESQYVFLHQCILDRLRLNDAHDENIYENELIYANATALKEYQNNMNKA